MNIKSCYHIYVLAIKYISIHNVILFRHKEKWSPVICSKMDGNGGHYAKWSKPYTEGQVLHVFSHMWNLNKVELSIKEWLLETGKGVFVGRVDKGKLGLIGAHAEMLH
jgi:hypothetical protein